MTTYVLMVFIYTISGDVEMGSAYFYSLENCEKAGRSVIQINARPEVKEVITVCKEE